VAVSPSCSVSRRRVVRVPLVRSASSVAHYPPSEFRVPPFWVSRNRFGVRAPVPLGHLCRPPSGHCDHRRGSLAAGGSGGHRGPCTVDSHATNEICGRTPYKWIWLRRYCPVSSIAVSGRTSTTTRSHYNPRC